MNAATERLLHRLQQSQKWDCYRPHPDGYILEAGWPYLAFGVEDVYSKDALAAAKAASAARWAALNDFAAENAADMTEDAFAMAAQAAGVA